jgi:hypothetical protein
VTVVGRRVRVVASAIVFALVVAGSLWGSDDDFPFGPFRMYATAARTDGVVSTPFLVLVDADGTELRPRSDVFGLRPAELEGRYPDFRADPTLLGSLAAAYESRVPDTDIVEARLQRRRRQLDDGRVVAESTDVVAVWHE